eukprot:3298833-Rhodomonas_salina.3
MPRTRQEAYLARYGQNEYSSCKGHPGSNRQGENSRDSVAEHIQEHIQRNRTDAGVFVQAPVAATGRRFKLQVAASRFRLKYMCFMVCRGSTLPMAETMLRTRTHALGTKLVGQNEPQQAGHACA